MATKITNDNIVNVDASKLTGSINANMLTGSLPAGMAPDPDLTPLQNDLAVLALHQAIAENKSAYSLQNTWIEQFEDDSGITDEVDADRNVAGEYVSSMTTAYGSATDMADGTVADTIHSLDNNSNPTAGWTNGEESPWRLYDPPSNLAEQTMYWTSPAQDYSIGFYIDYKSSYRWTAFKLSKNACYGDVRSFRMRYSDDGVTWHNADMTGTTAATWSDISPGYQNVISNFDSTGVMNMSAAPNLQNAGSHLTLGTPFSSRYLSIEIGTWAANSNSNVGWSQLIPTYTPETTTTSATGSFTSVAITPQDGANKSSLGLVLLYKDSQGTNALNTDISAQVSADNGVTYSDCVLAAKGTFSAGIKTAIAPAVDVTSGNQLKYKINFANQAPGVGGDPGDYGNSYSTGDRSSIITATTDVTFASGNISNMHNGVKTSFSNYFSGSSQSIASKYMRWQFNEARVVTEARWWNDEGDDGAFGTWRWQGSNDGSNWTDIGADFELNNLQLVGTAPSYQELTTLSGNTTAYTYYQMLGVSGTVSFHSNHLEIEFKCNTVPGTGGKVAQVHGVSLQY